jgi:hypothetical protein
VGGHGGRLVVRDVADPQEGLPEPTHLAPGSSHVHSKILVLPPESTYRPVFLEFTSQTGEFYLITQ